MSCAKVRFRTVTAALSLRDGRGRGRRARASRSRRSRRSAAGARGHRCRHDRRASHDRRATAATGGVATGDRGQTQHVLPELLDLRGGQLPRVGDAQHLLGELADAAVPHAEVPDPEVVPQGVPELPQVGELLPARVRVHHAATAARVAAAGDGVGVGGHGRTRDHLRLVVRAAVRRPLHRLLEDGVDVEQAAGVGLVRVEHAHRAREPPTRHLRAHRHPHREHRTAAAVGAQELERASASGVLAQEAAGLALVHRRTSRGPCLVVVLRLVLQVAELPLAPIARPQKPRERCREEHDRRPAPHTVVAGRGRRRCRRGHRRRARAGARARPRDGPGLDLRVRAHAADAGAVGRQALVDAPGRLLLRRAGDDGRVGHEDDTSVHATALTRLDALRLRLAAVSGDDEGHRQAHAEVFHGLSFGHEALGYFVESFSKDTTRPYTRPATVGGTTFPATRGVL